MCFFMSFSLGIAEINVREVEREDAGTYTLTATNPLGSQSVSARVHVLGK